MGKLTSRWDDHHDYIWKCDCGMPHFLEMSWDVPDPQWRYLSISDAWAGRTLKERVKGAWALLRGRWHYGTDILLDDRTVKEVLAALEHHSR